MKMINAIVQAHQKLATALELSLEHTLFSDPELADLAASLRERGWLEFPLKSTEVNKLEALVGFAFSPLLRALFETKECMPPFEVGVLGMREAWCGSSVFETNQEFLKLDRGDLPKLVILNNDEDFWAVTEDGKVVYVCRNEANIEKSVDSLETWLSLYVKAVETKASDVGDYDDEAFCDEELERFAT